MIPITKPYLTEEDARAASQTVLSGWVTQGPKVKEFEEAFARYVGAEHACAVSSCTTALHLALLAVGVKPGNLVITVSHSFIATANSIRYCGAEPVFVDIDPATFNLSAAALEELIGKRCAVRGGKLFLKNLSALAKGESPLKEFLQGKKKAPSSELGRIAAVLPVHQMGMPCDLKAVLNLARKFRLPVVEDAACAIGSEVSPDGGKTWEKIGRPAGDIACFSFHPRKIITTGDGGMLTTRHAKYDRRFRLLRQHAMTVSDTARHQSKKIVFESYETTGFNYRMTDIQAAVGCSQLGRLPDIVAKRRVLAERYRELLSEIPGLGLPQEPSWARSNWQSYCVRLPKGVSQKKVMQAMLDAGIATRRGIMCSHLEKAYKPNAAGFCLKESERAQRECVLLPLYFQMTEEEQASISKVLAEVVAGVGASA